jgi:hypothetical protein
MQQDRLLHRAGEQLAAPDMGISVHVVAIDADAKPDSPLVGHSGFAVDHLALHFGGTARRVDDTAEFHQQAVAGGLDGATVVLLDFRIHQLAKMCLEAPVRVLLIRSHQARIACHISGEDRGETAGRGHDRGSPPCSRLSVTTLYRRTRAPRYLVERLKRR